MYGFDILWIIYYKLPQEFLDAVFHGPRSRRTNGDKKKSCKKNEGGESGGGTGDDNPGGFPGGTGD